MPPWAFMFLGMIRLGPQLLFQFTGFGFYFPEFMVLSPSTDVEESARSATVKITDHITAGGSKRHDAESSVHDAIHSESIFPIHCSAA